ncbi:RluA family pseudouridine synthase [Gemelliphila palaticanis]|uniref:Pseudouridine synthase n=1 Tax=Gemelliphila palaticanis TaxID=81950 RepID=A0ABX2SZ76_9BACL|nr:RluA family pseudouridine synthase [Gemella palaticanis]MBF0715746.1 RluA family pseudouridine synthase [Gemella palaticanis]NYS47676.1 RluA family pseudouridine synthase [Gemella palaticanis]
MEKKEILFTNTNSERIDKFLLSQLQDFSRTNIQNLISEDYILVNEKPVKSNYKLKENDKITIKFKEADELDVVKQDIPIKIFYEDDYLIVINKDKGMVVHPSAGHKDGTLVNALMYHSEKLSSINGVIRPGIVHRIDKDTSGLLIVAKDDTTHIKLSEMISKKEVKRKYYALVHGVIKHDYGTIDAPIARNPKERKEMAVIDEGKPSITHFKVIERFEKYTLIECELETGRTHQIRVHMKYINFPLVGDLVYGPRKTMNTNGQMLHSKTLEFVHPITNKTIFLDSDLPEYFNEVLNGLEH